MKQFESFQLDTSNECLWRSGAQLTLPPKPFAVLRYMVENPGRLITHDELLDKLWPETYVQPQVLRTYVLDLRKALGDDAGRPRFIQTMPKRGYCFVAAVSEWDGRQRAGGLEHSRSRDESETKISSLSSIPSLDGKFDIGPVDEVIIGRGEELGLLHKHVETLMLGRRKIVFVTGEAGIGKTALVDAFSRRMNSSAQPVLIGRGQCVKGVGAKEEYYPVTEALAQLCASTDGELACRALSKFAPAWLSCLKRAPETSGANAVSPPAELRMPGDLCAAIEEMAACTPLIFIFEDLQWADDSTLHLISALARRRAQSMLMVVATYRPKDLTAEHTLKALKQDLMTRHLCAEIALKPLTKKAVAALVSRDLDRDPIAALLAGFVHRHSEGNPLFVIAILEHLIAQGFLVRGVKDGHARWEQRTTLEEMELGVPDGLAPMIELEIESLSTEDQRLLEAGSLMNVAFPAWAVAAALERDPAEIEEACDQLTRRLYFLERAGQDELPDGSRSAFYVFAHGLYREVLYQRQAATRRARRHVRIAVRLAEIFAGREADVAREMALHYEAAAEWPHALQALRSAARNAGERRANAEAVQLLEQALRITDHLSANQRIKVSSEICEELENARQTVSQALAAPPAHR